MKLNILPRVTIVKVTMNPPNRAMKIEFTFPNYVQGTTSPYPHVVIVITVE